MSSDSFDAIVIGAGMAGVSCAAVLSASKRVLLLEREQQPGYHSTGRSAALFLESYGNAQVRALSRASRSFLFEPPSAFTSAPIVKTRGALILVTEAQRALREAWLAQGEFAKTSVWIDAQSAGVRCPLLRTEAIIGALVQDDASDIDVDALLQGYLRLFKGRGGRLINNADVTSLDRGRAVWRVAIAGETFHAPVIVNASGAWADQIASKAGLGPLGLIPKRRTAAIIDAPDSADVERMPMIFDIAEQFYLKPDAGRLLISPADETPSPACDAQPEDLDVAVAVDRVEAVTHLAVRRVAHKWAGLRTFASDNTPVVGFDSRAEGFFWLAGQGGYGIQTAPAMAELAAALIADGAAPARVIDHGLNIEEVKPARLLNASALARARAS